MNGKDFKQLKNPANVYCLVSTDAEMIDLYISRFKQMINANIVNYGSIQPSGGLFNNTVLNVLYMPKLDAEIFNRSEYIFIHTDSVDKRQTIYKTYKDRFIELNNDYTQYIINNSSMSIDEAKQLAQINDLGIIKSELTIYNETKKCYNKINNIFMWVEDFIKGNKPFPVEDSPIAILSLLSTNCTNLLKIKAHKTQGLNPYMVHKLSELLSYRNESELQQIISDCFYLDCQVKKGLIDVNVLLKYMIHKYIGGKHVTN